MDTTKVLITGFAVVLAAALLWGLVWYVGWVNYSDNYQLPYAFNKFTGKIEILPHTGWVALSPVTYNFHKIDLRPRQLCINANNRVLNCKLVKFRISGLDKFVEWHGAGAFDNDEAGYNILKSYAFDTVGGADCPFIIVTDTTGKSGLAQAPDQQ